MLWSLWEEKLFGNGVLSSSAMEVCHVVNHLAMLEGSVQYVHGCLEGDSPGLIQTTEFMAASGLLL